MRYPKFLKKENTIGYIAPSYGVFGYPYQQQYFSAKNKFIDLGYKIIEANSVHKFSKTYLASNNPKKRAKEFMNMYLNNEIQFLHSVAGGELLFEMLPYLNYHKLIHSEPKWFMGYSDNTFLIFTLTTICDVATIYGYNVNNFGMEKWDKSIDDAYQLMIGNKLEFKSYPKYQLIDLSKQENNALCSYNLTEESIIKTFDGNDFTVTGRIIGGCLDCLVSLVGTPYDQLEEFKIRYENDGIILYFESCELTPVSFLRALLQMKEAGWFNNIKAIIFGRPGNDEDFMNLSFEKALKRIFKNTNIKIAYGFDIGHVQPTWTIINGALATITINNQKTEINYQLI